MLDGIVKAEPRDNRGMKIFTCMLVLLLVSPAFAAGYAADAEQCKIDSMRAVPPGTTATKITVKPATQDLLRRAHRYNGEDASGLVRYSWFWFSVLIDLSFADTTGQISLICARNFYGGFVLVNPATRVPIVIDR